MSAGWYAGTRQPQSYPTKHPKVRARVSVCRNRVKCYRERELEMKHPVTDESYFFVDESGDSTFYDAKGHFHVGTEGCSPVLILGFVETQKPQEMRRAVLRAQQSIISDPYLAGIPSIAKTGVALHAKDDASEVRYLFYKELKSLPFKAQFIVARKIERIFRSDHGASEDRFYDDLISRLFQNVLHRFQHNHIVFSTRGSRERRRPLEEAIKQARTRFEEKYKVQAPCTTFEIEPQSPKGEPCLSVIDYMNWAVQRAYTRREMRYYNFVEDKVSLLWDIYDFGKKPYCRKNPFDIEKAAPLGLGSR
jgi:hypothetical protein